MLEGSGKLWKHEVPEGLRLAEWRRAAERREDCKGLGGPAGVDRGATAALMRSTEITPYQHRLLQGMRSGSLRLPARLHNAGLKDSRTCEFCGQAPESVEHCFWHCQRWSEESYHEDLPREEELAEWLACTKSLGMFFEDWEVVNMMDKFSGAAETWPQQVERQ